MRWCVQTWPTEVMAASAADAANPRMPKGTSPYSYGDAVARIEEPLVGVHSE
jgi:hypothetical protein